MSNPLIRIHDMATGKIIDREMTNAEHAEWQAQQAEAEAQAIVVADKTEARQAVLNKLGLTADEAAALLG